jgi:transglycosylase-like protein with SLT domain
MVRLHARSFVKGMSFLAVFSLLLNFIAVPKTAGQQQVENRLMTAFQDAAKESGVPWPLLAAVAYAETHFYENNGPSSSNGYGLMHLVENTNVNTLELAAKLTGVPPEVLKTNTAENIRGGAALLRAYADELEMDEKGRRDLAAWYRVVARYSNATDPPVARLYADEVYKLMKSGFRGASRQGEEVIVPATQVDPLRTS